MFSCHACNMLMFVGDIECPHCRHELTQAQQNAQIKSSDNSWRKGLAFGASVMIAFLIIVSLMLLIS